MSLILSSIKPFKYNSLDEILCKYFNCDFNRLNKICILEKEINYQLNISYQELKHSILIQGNFAFVDNDNNFHYWKNETCSAADFLHTLIHHLLDINKDYLDKNEDIKNEQITQIALKGYEITQKLFR